jgi:hypothetical protein
MIRVYRPVNGSLTHHTDYYIEDNTVATIARMAGHYGGVVGSHVEKGHTLILLAYGYVAVYRNADADACDAAT